jgi:dTDP-4-amino-4,6-dideoxygalactose transaminase
VARFEEMFAERRRRCAVATSSTALHLALVLAGVDRAIVICPSYTFIAIANAVLHGRQAGLC